MKYTNTWVENRFENEELKFLFFWGHQPLKNGKLGKSCFSQWFEKEFENEGVVYKTTEHWMMAEKARLFHDEVVLSKILKSNSAAEVKKFGRQILNFDETIWNNSKYDIVKKGNYLKFSQNKDLLQFLLTTKNRILVEASPYDSIWGIGMSANDEYINNPTTWKGLNLLGYALMEVRDLLEQKKINMNYKIKKFKDNQVAATVLKNGDIDVVVRGNSYEDLFTAASVKEAWDAERIANKNAIATLTILCLIGQRSDRRFNKGESFDLKVIADFINSMNFDKVSILHPHSPISLALINNSEKISHFNYVKQAFEAIGNPVLVSPDAGAYKTTHEIAEELNADLVPSNKVRVDGAPKISIQGDVKGKKCLIVDDLADGGRTFKFLAQELKLQAAVKVFLYVTHAQFNYGFDELKEFIDGVYCTNSYKDIDDDFVVQFNVI